MSGISKQSKERKLEGKRKRSNTTSYHVLQNKFCKVIHFLLVLHFYCEDKKPT